MAKHSEYYYDATNSKLVYLVEEENEFDANHQFVSKTKTGFRFSYYGDGNRTSRTVNDYDERGNRIKRTMYDANDKPNYTEEYAYGADEQGKQKGKFVKTISYSYDAEGKAVGRYEMLFDEAGEKV